MAREIFKNLPDTSTPLNASKLNGLFNGAEPMGSIVVDDVECKNLLGNFSTGNINGNTGIVEEDTNWACSQFINVKSNEAYTFSLSTNNYQQWLWAYYKEDGTFISMDYGDFGTENSSITKTMPSDCSKVRVGWRLDLNYSNVQLEKGSEATEYTPYKKFGYNSQESMGKIVVDDISSSNLFNPNDLTFGKWLEVDGQEKVGNEKDVLTNFIKVAPNTKYTISGFSSSSQWLVVCGYDVSKTFSSLLIPSTGSGNHSWNFTTSTTDEYIRCGFSDIDMGNETLQIEKGNATPYKPHKQYGYNSKESMGKIVVDDLECKNKFDINTMVELRDCYRQYLQGAIVNNADFDGIKIPVKPNTEYSFSTDGATWSNLCFLDGASIYMSGETFVEGNYLVTPSNCHYISIAVQKGYTWCQLEKGKVITPHTPYKEFNNKHMYSTSEHIVGTWIDGRDIYEKTYVLGARNNTTQQRFEIGLGDITVIDINAIAREFNDPWRTFNISNEVYTAWGGNVLLQDPQITNLTTNDENEMIITLQYAKIHSLL